MTSVAMFFLRAYRTSNDVSGNGLPTCLQIRQMTSVAMFFLRAHRSVKCRQWQWSSHVPTGRHMTSVAMVFPRAYRTPHDVSGNVLPTRLQDVK